MNNYQRHLTTAGFIALLAGCGGGGGSNTGSVDTPQKMSFGLLKPVTSTAEMDQSLKRGLASTGAVNGIGELFTVTDSLEAVPAAGNDEGFSSTTLQVAGVDEADITKYDGEIMYVVDQSFQPEPELTEDASLLPPQASNARIRLYRTDPLAITIEEVSQISLGADDIAVNALYLSDNPDDKTLIGIGQTNSFVPWELFALDYYWQEGQTEIRAWDVSNPAAPDQQWAIELDGSLLTSRRIDNILYVVTRYTPGVEGIIAYAATEEDIAANEALLESVPLDDLLPNVRHDSGAPQELLDASDCYLANPDYEGLTLPVTSGSLITISAIDLQVPGSITSICLNTFASGFYASRESLYITASNDADSTLIHKVALNNGNPGYRGSGEVPGYIGSSNPSFLMSEEGTDLRVFSSSWAGRQFPLPVMDLDDADVAEATEAEDFGIHKLTILRESQDDTSLQQIAQLPNSQRPAHIGKPREDLYAARFLGDRAYAVTFEVIDPLYVLDLANPEDPRISGELELPGFSTLLQPLGVDLLLGVGQEVPADNSGLTRGIKVALFNVADISAPVELGSIVVGKRGSYSPTLFNHHTLTLLETDGIYRAAIPIQRHATLQNVGDDTSAPGYWYRWTDSGVYKFEIDPSSGNLSLIGSLITAESDDEQPWTFTDLSAGRSVIHNDALFYSQQAEVWAQDWSL